MSAKFYGFIINGKGGVGKDDFIKTVMDLPEYKQTMYYNLSLIDEIKRVAEKEFGWKNNDKSDKGRKLLSDIFVATKEYNNYPLIAMENKVRNIMSVYNNAPCTNGKDIFVFFHAREPRDINYIRSFLIEGAQFDVVKTILIRRPDLEDKTYGNVSDDGVDGYEYNHVYVRPKMTKSEREKLDAQMFKRFAYTGKFPWPAEDEETF